MNYQFHYDKLIQRAQNRQPEGYVEKHHIIPKCLGGSNKKDNMVKLYPEEHYVAHQLLVKIYPDNSKLVYAANRMTAKNKNVNRSNNKLYSWLQLKLSISMSGENNPNFGKYKELSTMWGKKHSDVSKAKISSARIGISNLALAERNKKQIGELNPMFGRTGDKHHMFGKRGKETSMFGKKNPALLEYNRKKRLRKAYLKNLERDRS